MQRFGLVSRWAVFVSRGAVFVSRGAVLVSRGAVAVGLLLVLATGGWLAWMPARAEDPAEPVLSAKSEHGKKGQKMVTVYVFDQEGNLVGPVDSPKLVLTDAEWKKRLTPEQFKIVRAKGTERAFCGTLLDNKLKGVYSCVGCGLPLFSSDAKFHSGTGWPSFFKPMGKGNVVEQRDVSHGMLRTEILCGRCDGHLGHVFDDGPEPTGLRYCLNSESLTFTPEDKLSQLADPAAAEASKSNR